MRARVLCRPVAGVLTVTIKLAVFESARRGLSFAKRTRTTSDIFSGAPHRGSTALGAYRQEAHWTRACSGSEVLPRYMSRADGADLLTHYGN